ncbi:hypothetical protein K443DRAFT_132857 [Laccaria amethystina LaAM-08-1]|uniref:AP complex mu/sigma subunit domain-containing protein n=1 Tax=Laccaria amethystina LaAM-08-1 TaxID=1095629 RepID=A0A0C9XED8_9AGAR|nr:hypothetical protein K443DRAFT_132857 [Laccaria amethystina LaAM-08-1]
MIRFILPYDHDEKVRFIFISFESYDSQIRLRGEVHTLVTPRDQKYQSNLSSFAILSAFSATMKLCTAGKPFFCLCVDASDNELAYLEPTHLLVEILGTILISVYAILKEIFLAGEIEETSKDVVLLQLEELEKLE